MYKKVIFAFFLIMGLFNPISGGVTANNLNPGCQVVLIRGLLDYVLSLSFIGSILNQNAGKLNQIRSYVNHFFFFCKFFNFFCAWMIPFLNSKISNLARYYSASYGVNPWIYLAIFIRASSFFFYAWSSLFCCSAPFLMSSSFCRHTRAYLNSGVIEEHSNKHWRYFVLFM